MTYDRILVPAAVALGIGAGTILPVMRAMAKSGASGLTFHQPRRNGLERAVGGIVGLLGIVHALWGVLYAVFGAEPLGVYSPPPALFFTGFAVYVFGVLFIASAQRQMGKSWRIGIETQKTVLVTDGIYGKIRNPIYLGVIVLGFASLAMTPSIVSLVGALGYWIAIQIQARYEENHLLEANGEECRRFLDRVGRFVPIPRRKLSARERALLGQVAEAIIPAGAAMPAAAEPALKQLEALLEEAPSASSHLVRLVLRGIAIGSVLSTGRGFASLSRERREQLLNGWLLKLTGLRRMALRAVVALIKSAHLETAEVSKALGARVYPPRPVETPRWLTQMTDGGGLSADESVECDVVVIGTGAGGAPVAYELAAKGHAVVLLEEGRYFGRHEFNGRPTEMGRKMFRDRGLTFALGNVAAPVWVGMTVGGTTTVNSGTCYRTPERTMKRWRDELGLQMFSESSMEKYFVEVERVLGIAPTETGQLTGGARAAQRGAEKLGLRAHPIHRNATGCDGQGRCMYGCPTDAKRSTNVSYVPMALEKGARLFAQTRADELLIENGKVAGLIARTAGGARVTIRAKATILSGGALMTPLFLIANKVGNASGMVGKNLSLHPAAPVIADFAEEIRMEHGVPQGFAIDAFADKGIMIEESSNPPEVIGVALPVIGARFTQLIERYQSLSAFGFMIQDTSRGQVQRGPRGQLKLTYSLNEPDTRMLQSALVSMVEVFLAAGAKAVFPAVRGFDELTDAAGLEKLRAHRLEPGDFAVSAVHPLGTARMGVDPATSVVGPDHGVHGMPGLFIVDGSAVPTSLGVNPQVTIMAMALRASEQIHERL